MSFEHSLSYIKKEIEELKIPYFAIVVKKGREIIFEYDYKENDVNNNLLLMYSMSKPITCVALMQLVEKGLINLDDDVSKYLPNYKNLKNINTGEPIHNSMKIWHIMSMTSGMDYAFQRKSIQELAKLKPNASTIEVCSVLAKDGLQFNPGDSFQYSLSVDVAAAIVEIVSKQKFSSYVKENIFDRLGMNDSTFRQDLALASKCRDEYWPTEDKSSLEKKGKLYKGFFPTTEYESGGAGLISTVKDYSLFADSLANSDNKLLKDKTVEQLSALRVIDTPFNETVQEYSKSNVNYGYGFGVRVRKHDSPEGIPQGEFGWDGAAGSYSLIDRKNNISIVMGLTIPCWPDYIKDFHLRLVEKIYIDLFKRI